MPCNIPSYIFDLDEVTAHRLALQLASRRKVMCRVKAATIVIVLICALALSLL